MDYDAIDRIASQCVVTCVQNATRFFLTANGLATDIPIRARLFPDSSSAELAATEANQERAWSRYGMRWEAFPAINLV
jgi:hypothetical protein